MAESLSTKAKKKPGRPPGLSGVTKRNVLYVQKLFQEHAIDALNVMTRLMNDESVDPPVRLKAANDILNRAYGTPVSTQVVMQLNSEENASPIDRTAIAKASTPELIALAEALARFTQKAEQENLIDVTPNLPDNYPQE